MTTAPPDYENVEIPRDHWGRPLVLPPQGGKRVAYRRTTTFVGCLDDTTGLQRWKTRMVALGMGQRKDLTLAAAAANPDDKKTLDDIAEKALEQAQAGAAAMTGTALHSLTERIDRGQELGHVPHEYVEDLKAYEKATAHIEWLDIECFRVHDEWQVAGTADRIGRDTRTGRISIYDLKTGSVDFPHKMAMQLAMYADMIPYDIATDTRGVNPDGLDVNDGVIIHLPAGQGRCDLYSIDLRSARGACALARKVWAWRGQKGLTRLLPPGGEDAPITPTWELLIAAASTVDELRVVWTQAKDSGDLNESLKALCMARSAELGA